jgi:KDO2-lipid IV(A) lauroyltransferase
MKLLGAILGWLVGSLLRIRRAHVAASMERAGLDPALAPFFYRSLGRSTVEMLFGAEARIDDRSLARFRTALAKGRGVVIAASHTGNFEIAMRFAATLAPLLAVTKRQSVRIVDWLIRKLRRSHGVREHGAMGAMRAARAHLASGGAVAMIIDQVPERSTLRVPFLGATAFVDRAPAVLARRARCPIVVAAAHRDGAGVQRIEVLDVIEDAPIDEAMRRATRTLEAFVLAHPTEWLWMHRRCKRPAVGTTRPSPPSTDHAATIGVDAGDTFGSALPDGARGRAVQSR